MLWSPLLETFLFFVLTSALSVLIGGLLGIAMGTSRVLDAILGPGVDTLAAIPAVAFVPLWIIWFGPNELALVPFTLVLSVPAMAINSRSGLRSTDPALIEMARAEAATSSRRSATYSCRRPFRWWSRGFALRSADPSLA